eukprot:11554036-Alexandrium_andersonii.AAC.1
MHNGQDTTFTAIAEQAAHPENLCATPVPSHEFLPSVLDVTYLMASRHPAKGHGKQGIATAIMRALGRCLGPMWHQLIFKAFLSG